MSFRFLGRVSSTRIHLCVYLVYILFMVMCPVRNRLLVIGSAGLMLDLPTWNGESWTLNVGALFSKPPRTL